MRVAVVLMPDGADVARIGFEEQARRGEDAPGRVLANRARCRQASFRDGALPFEAGFAFRAGVVVRRHRLGNGFVERSVLDLLATMRAPAK